MWTSYPYRSGFGGKKKNTRSATGFKNAQKFEIAARYFPAAGGINLMVPNKYNMPLEVCLTTEHLKEDDRYRNTHISATEKKKVQ